MAERVTYNEFNEKVIGFLGLAIVDFYSDTCVPCKKMSPILSALEKQYPEEVYINKEAEKLKMSQRLCKTKNGIKMNSKNSILCGYNYAVKAKKGEAVITSP